MRLMIANDAAGAAQHSPQPVVPSSQRIDIRAVLTESLNPIELPCDAGRRASSSYPRISTMRIAVILPAAISHFNMRETNVKSRITAFRFIDMVIGPPLRLDHSARRRGNG